MKPAVPSHWDRHARNWHYFGSPLRPAPEDVRWMEAALSRLPGAPRALLLGVTPEYAALAWPAGTRLLAVDINRAMIRHVWPKHAVPQGACVVCGEWTQLPLADASVDVVLGDGVTFSHEVCGLEAEIRRVLKSAGRYLIRAFVRPKQQESLDRLHEDLHTGRIGSFHAYKWRLAMALHASLEEGVRPANIWRVWHERVPDPVALARQTGWLPEVIATIDAYRDAVAVYSFPTLDELKTMLQVHFEIVTLHFPGYELGERCPLVELRPRARP